MTVRVSFGTLVKDLVVALGWIVLYAVVGTAFAWVLLKVNPVRRTSAWYGALGAAALTLGFGASTWVVGVRLGRRPLGYWGWRGGVRALRWFGRGLALALAMAVVAVGLALAASHARVWFTDEPGHYLAAVGPLAVFLLAAALFEELTFRGFPLRRLADAIGPGAAVAFGAVAFAAAHIGNPHAGALGAVNIGLAALWLSLAFFSPGGMPYAWALHFGWNAGLALVFDAPVSGQRLLVPAVEYAPGRHPWVDGGAFGPEGGIVATLVLLAGTAAVLGRRMARPREWAA